MKLTNNVNIYKNKSFNIVKHCSKCKTEKILQIIDGYSVCQQCGESELILMANYYNRFNDLVITEQILVSQC